MMCGSGLQAEKNVQEEKCLGIFYDFDSFYYASLLCVVSSFVVWYVSDDLIHISTPCE